MECSQFKAGIFAFLEGSLSEELRQSYECHLASCTACSRLLTEFKTLDVIIEQEKAGEPNPFVSSRILQRLETEFIRPEKSYYPVLIRVFQPVIIAIALLCGIIIGTYTAKKDKAPANQLVDTSENIEFLRSSLFISEFADEDKILVLNK